ncbi:OmpA family protein [Rhodovastum atsumiense]|uniref:OmpA family protein n=1 Tax=Rhodovastum atsumiense TaxID=504468 RepID=A0A5M6IS52_9PROT|nr:OmpA family protein [Rhodovastum atsumiense]KAA5610739.1 OmpA family protein [Rhodovastum atsumiense]
MKRALLATTLIALPLAARAQPIEGLYVGGGAGANWLEQERIRSSTVGGVSVRLPGDQRLNFDPGFAAVGSVGWGFGNGVRLELEGSYRRNGANKGSVPTGVTALGGDQKTYGAMANVLFDMDIGSPYVFPYLGAGAGYQWLEQRSWQVAGGTQQSWSGTQGGFAYQAIAGTAFPVPWVVGLSATLEYRFLGVNGKQGYSGPGGLHVITSDQHNHSALVGLRYAFNVTPPAGAVAPVPAPVTAPAPAPTRSYLVFFDWNSAALTDRARQIVAEAAQATTRVQVTRIEVAGHADKTGTAAYNQRLSLQRAEVVAAELVRNGVPRQAITVQGFGETRPLVPTAEGVREPQNRRVEIVLK